MTDTEKIKQAFRAAIEVLGLPPVGTRVRHPEEGTGTIDHYSFWGDGLNCYIQLDDDPDDAWILQTPEELASLEVVGEKLPEVGCSCGGCVWKLFLTGGAWCLHDGPWVLDGGLPSGFAIACPICGDLLYGGGEIMQMVSLGRIADTLEKGHWPWVLSDSLWKASSRKHQAEMVAIMMAAIGQDAGKPSVRSLSMIDVRQVLLQSQADKNIGPEQRKALEHDFEAACGLH